MIKPNSSEHERKLLMQKEDDERKIAESCRRESKDNMKSAEVSLRLMSEILAETDD